MDPHTPIGKKSEDGAGGQVSGGEQANLLRSSPSDRLAGFIPQFVPGIETAFDNLPATDTEYLFNNPGIPVNTTGADAYHEPGLEPDNHPRNLVHPSAGNVRRKKASDTRSSNQAVIHQVAASKVRKSGSTSSGAKPPKMSKPKPVKPGNRELLAFENEVLRKFYAVNLPGAAPLGADDDVTAWYYSWHDARHYPFEGVSKAWGLFLREHCSPAELQRRTQAEDQHEEAIKKFKSSSNTWNKKKQIEARYDPELMAKAEEQRDAWGDTDQKQRERWRVESLPKNDAEDVQAMQPGPKLRKVQDNATSEQAGELEDELEESIEEEEIVQPERDWRGSDQEILEEEYEEECQDL